jgi:dTDP-glucose 4,6-dehydratase
MHKTLIVTGGAGFIGGELVRQLVADEPELTIVNLDKLTYAGVLDSLTGVVDAPNHVFVQGDVSDQQLLAKLFSTYRPQSFVHLAAESHVDRSIDGPAAFVQTNVCGTVAALEAARLYYSELTADERARFRFLHVSTDEVYGSLAATGAFSETSPYDPRSPYSASKASADHFVRAYHHTYGLPTLITNCSNNYGPYQFPEKLVPMTILSALGGRPIHVYGDGLNVRDWLFTPDHCRALRLVLDRGAPGETYNIGGQCERTNLQVVREICDLVDRELPNLPQRPSSKLIQFVADRPGHDRRYAIDASKIRRELGWTPQQDFSAGLAMTVRWYLANQPWVEKALAGKYHLERLGTGNRKESLDP